MKDLEENKLGKSNKIFWAICVLGFLFLVGSLFLFWPRTIELNFEGASALKLSKKGESLNYYYNYAGFLAFPFTGELKKLESDELKIFEAFFLGKKYLRVEFNTKESKEKKSDEIAFWIKNKLKTGKWIYYSIEGKVVKFLKNLTENDIGKSLAEKEGKVIIPKSTAEQLLRLHTSYDLQKIENKL